MAKRLRFQQRRELCSSGTAASGIDFLRVSEKLHAIAFLIEQESSLLEGQEASTQQESYLHYMLQDRGMESADNKVSEHAGISERLGKSSE